MSADGFELSGLVGLEERRALAIRALKAQILSEAIGRAKPRYKMVEAFVSLYVVPMKQMAPDDPFESSGKCSSEMLEELEGETK